MADSNFYLPIVNSSGDVQANVSVAVEVDTGSGYSALAGSPFATDTNGILTIPIASSGVYKCTIGGSGTILTEIAKLNKTDALLVNILSASGVSQADLTKLAAISATANQIDVTIVTAGTATDEKALVLNGSNELDGGTLVFNGVTWKIGATTVTATGADLNLTAGLAAQGKTLATTDMLTNVGGGGGGGVHQINISDISGITFTTTIYKTVYVGSVGGGSFRLQGIELFTLAGTPTNITNIKVNKISPSGVATTLYESGTLSWSDGTAVGMNDGNFSNLLDAVSGSISAVDKIEVQVKITGTSIGYTTATLHFVNTTSPSQVLVSGNANAGA